eukprot:6482808-Amphidinium_carterae.1
MARVIQDYGPSAQTDCTVVAAEVEALLRSCHKICASFAKPRCGMWNAVTIASVDYSHYTVHSLYYSNLCKNRDKRHYITNLASQNP